MSFFDEIARDYDAWYKTGMGSFAGEVETMLAFDLFVPAQGIRVLDVGCGTASRVDSSAPYGRRSSNS